MQQPTRGALHSGLALNEDDAGAISHHCASQAAGTSNKHAEGRNRDPAETP